MCAGQLSSGIGWRQTPETNAKLADVWIGMIGVIHPACNHYYVRKPDEYADGVISIPYRKNATAENETRRSDNEDDTDLAYGDDNLTMVALSR